jgi:DNA polymerase III alpha subunit
LNKLPDIDMDFPHDRKDDVVDLIFAKYTREHCAVVGGFSTFQARSAFADVAKVLGVAEREVRRFTEHFPWSFGGGWVPDEHTPSGGAKLRELLAASPENRDLPLNEEPFKTALDVAEFLDGFPRNPKDAPVRGRAVAPAHARTDADVHFQQGLSHHAFRHGRRGSHRPGED